MSINNLSLMLSYANLLFLTKSPSLSRLAKIIKDPHGSPYPQYPVRASDRTRSYKLLPWQCGSCMHLVINLRSELVRKLAQRTI